MDFHYSELPHIAKDSERETLRENERILLPIRPIVRQSREKRNW